MAENDRMMYQIPLERINEMKSEIERLRAELDNKNRIAKTMGQYCEELRAENQAYRERIAEIGCTMIDLKETLSSLRAENERLEILVTAYKRCEVDLGRAYAENETLRANALTVEEAQAMQRYMESGGDAGHARNWPALNSARDKFQRIAAQQT